jgi:hypothetical protein
MSCDIIRTYVARGVVQTLNVNEMIREGLVHEVHTSERRSYRGCRRRWHWVFQDFYYPQVTAKPLEFGVAFHEAMEVLYNPDTWKWDREVVKNSAIQVFTNTCKEQKKKFLNSNSAQYFQNEEVEEDYEERVELGVAMLNYYCDQVAPEYDKHLTPLKVEVSFMVPINNPDDGSYLFCHCNRCWKTYCEYIDNRETSGDTPDPNWVPLEQQEGEREIWTQTHTGLLVCLAGRIDLLAEDEHGHYWIVDWKTAARLARGDVSGQDRDEFLELDDQIGSYVMALRRKLGLNVRGFIYVELKKAKIEPPARNRTIRLGRMYSVNKNQAVDYDLYKKTVMTDDAAAYEEGLYDEFLTWLKEGGQNYHARYQLVKTDEELEEIERYLYQEAKEMTSKETLIYPSPGRFSCGFCAFRQPCIEKFRQGDYQYMLDTLFDKREKHYWVKELSTDKQGGE